MNFVADVNDFLKSSAKRALISIITMNYNNIELVYQPIIYSPTSEEKEIKALMEKGALVFDQIDSQFQELIKIKHPKENFTDTELASKAKEITDTPFYYGVWVYYPWNNQLLHLLGEEEFALVRTSRNQHKITVKEQAELNVKKIGIIGLSVGHSIAITLAMERAFGELRLCDFDVLELSNYNRIRTKLTHIGMKKTVSVAREIAEIDPFLNVRCFHEGLTTENIDAFFCEGGMLDLCVDECDGIDMKILCRLKAIEYRVPVIMEASDNCTLDVERFDLEPGRPILHGKLKGLDPSKVADLKTSEEKMPYMLAFVPPHMMSTRMAASFLELGQSISTWPQLASSVNYGGGICASISRQILLGQHTSSGKWQLDVGQHFSNPEPTLPEKIEDQPEAPSVYNFDEMLSDFPVIPDLSKLEKVVTKIVEDACLAPSGGNMQPWHFHFDTNKGLFLFLDKSYVSHSIDYQFVASMVALGAASENLLLSAENQNVPLQFNYFTDFLNDHPVAHFFPTTEKNHPFPKLYQFIEQRQTNRMLGDQSKIDELILQSLSQKALTSEGVQIKWLNYEQHEQFATIFARIERARLLDPQCHLELMQELRWTREEELAKRNGVAVESLDLTSTERASLDFLKRGDALKLIDDWDLGKGLVKLFRKTVHSASAIGVICANSDSYEDLFNVGRSLERLWLDANGNQLAFQPVSPVTLLHLTQKKGADKFMTENANNEIKKHYQSFVKLLDLPEGFQPFFAFKLAKTSKKAPVSVRKETPISYSK